MRSQNNDLRRYFASREELCSEPGDVAITASKGEMPLEAAMIDLSCRENGESYCGKLDASGTVHLSDVATGQYAVTLLPPEGPPPLPGVPLEKQEQLPWKLPRKVRRPETTPLTAEVTEGSNEFTFDVSQEDVASQKK
ncbi:hypothetical protein [Blastopirellula retiformator]|uniref:Cna protein B-type domain protein n=1 Tax=Blastopirellula retiformator TaxID=2527970 RepID=A0A5C5V4Z1_9BACT|nr:hypothetical protein [Blastopirellula retiformator]TWT33130.1 hypothetical protein Enr8_29500 [Blastopirellula retiformator]